MSPNAGQRNYYNVNPCGKCGHSYADHPGGRGCNHADGCTYFVKDRERRQEAMMRHLKTVHHIDDAEGYNAAELHAADHDRKDWHHGHA